MPISLIHTWLTRTPGSRPTVGWRWRTHTRELTRLAPSGLTDTVPFRSKPRACWQRPGFGFEAIRVGIDEIVKLKQEIRIAPVDLTQSQQVRLERLFPRATLKVSEAALFVPAPTEIEVVPFVLQLLAAMWPDQTAPVSA